jgi:hypothetical protein
MDFPEVMDDIEKGRLEEVFFSQLPQEFLTATVFNPAGRQSVFVGLQTLKLQREPGNRQHTERQFLRLFLAEDECTKSPPFPSDGVGKDAQQLRERLWKAARIDRPAREGDLEGEEGPSERGGGEAPDHWVALRKELNATEIFVIHQVGVRKRRLGEGRIAMGIVFVGYIRRFVSPGVLAAEISLRPFVCVVENWKHLGDW